MLGKHAGLSQVAGLSEVASGNQGDPGGLNQIMTSSHTPFEAGNQSKFLGEKGTLIKAKDRWT